MRELKTSEFKEVSGAGCIADLGSSLGEKIGILFDAKNNALYGKTTTFADSISTLGEGIGQILELNFSSGIDNIKAGINDIISGIQSLFASANSSS